MFYLKSKDGQKVEFEGEFYTDCAICGREMVIDLGEFDELDPFDSVCFCSKECGEIYRVKNNFKVYRNE